ncbi:hypothetical protein BH09VER1_BH09VER1_20590 [soil metagenome]
MRDFAKQVVVLNMKMTMALATALFLIGENLSTAGPTASAPRIIEYSKTSALRLENVRWDAPDGKIRGTAYLNRGYSPPDRSHVHIYALNAAGKVLYAGCDTLSGQSLATRPQFPQGGDAFSAKVPADLKGIQTITVVAESGHSECKPDDNRLLKLFNR